MTTVADGATDLHAPVRYDSDPDLLATVLRVYKVHCRYLTSAMVTRDGRDGGGLRVRGEFDIPESCYIDDTGHFNSVEFNICYNQMLYYLVAKSIKERLLPAFADWTLEDYWAQQLPNFFIATFESAFRTPMRGRRFFGELALRKVRLREDPVRPRPMIWLQTTCGYWEDSGGRCDGAVLVAVRQDGPATNGADSAGAAGAEA